MKAKFLLFIMVCLCFFTSAVIAQEQPDNTNEGRFITIYPDRQVSQNVIIIGEDINPITRSADTRFAGGAYLELASYYAGGWGESWLTRTTTNFYDVKVAVSGFYVNFTLVSGLPDVYFIKHTNQGNDHAAINRHSGNHGCRTFNYNGSGKMAAVNTQHQFVKYKNGAPVPGATWYAPNAERRDFSCAS